MADLRTIDETAQRLRLKPKTVRRWVFLRKVSYVKVGASVRIPEAEIRRIIEGRNRAPASAEDSIDSRKNGGPQRRSFAVR